MSEQVTIKRLEDELENLQKQYTHAVNQATAVSGAIQFVESLIKDIQAEQNGDETVEDASDARTAVNDAVVVSSGNTGG